MEFPPKISTTVRTNSVNPHSFGASQAPLTPRRNGFTPLPRPIEAPYAPEKPRQSVGTLDKKTLEIFQNMGKKTDRTRSSSLKIVKQTQQKGFSYLDGKSAQEVLSPIASPRAHTTSPNNTDQGDDLSICDSPPLRSLALSPAPPIDHLKGPPPGVPRLQLEFSPVRSLIDPATDDFDSAFTIKKGEALTLADLNEIFGQYIPADYRDLDPNTEEIHAMHSFNLTPLQITSFPVSDDPQTITFGRCAVSDPILESICYRNKELTQAVLFNCLKLERPSFLMSYVELQELSFSWCTNMSFDWFAEIPEGSWAKLTTLELANTTVTNEELHMLPPLPLLNTIDLSHCLWIDDESFVWLLKHPMLTRIKIEGVNITDAAIKKIKELRPNIELIGEPKPQVVILNEPALVQEQVEVTDQSAEYFPFLRRYMFDTNKIDSWEELFELNEFSKDIARFYEQELKVRGLSQLVPLDTPEGWFLAERALQQHDEPNLTKIMDKLVPLLRKEGYFKVPMTAENLRMIKEGKKLDADVDCFMALWEMTVYPRMLNKITSLDLSNIGITEIPQSFCRLFFSQLESLSFARNPIAKLPQDFIEEFPAKDAEFSVIRVQNFFSKCPSLKKIDFSGCELKSIEGVFSFLSPSPKGPPERISILPHLEVANFSENIIDFLPDVFGISPDRMAQKLVIDLSKNDITRVQQKALDDLGASEPIQITLDLRDHVIMPTQIGSMIPQNVHLIRGMNVNHLYNGFDMIRQANSSISPKAHSDAYYEQKDKG